MRAALRFFFCGQEHCLPGQSFGPAVRPHHLLHFVLSGSGTFQDSNGTIRLGAGEGFLILPGEVTLYKADSVDPWEYCWIGFDGQEVPDILYQCGLGQATKVFRYPVEPVVKILHRLLGLFLEGQASDFLYLSYMYQLFDRLKSQSGSKRTDSPGSYVDQACQYIHNNYSYNIRIADLAQMIGIDRTYLFKLFINEKAVSPHHYLLNQRLTAACALLAQSELNVTQVMYSCGFQDMPSFIRIFKKRYGTTPGRYRQENRTVAEEKFLKIADTNKAEIN